MSKGHGELWIRTLNVVKCMELMFILDNQVDIRFHRIHKRNERKLDYLIIGQEAE